MNNTTVKTHKRKGRVVKSHSRAVKGSMKNGSSMSKEDCQAKYEAMVAKYGEDSPQAKKLAMKMESLETVEKNGRRYTAPSKTSAQAKKDADERERKRKEGVSRKIGKHSRGSFTRKPIDEELLTKEARKKAGTKKVSAGEKADYGRMMKMATSKDPKQRKAYKEEVAKNRAKAKK